MTFGDLKAMTALALGNLRDGDPYYQKLGWAVNAAIKEVPKRVLGIKGDYNQFPELQVSWREETVAGTHEYAIPANCILAYKLYSLDYSGAFLGEGVGSSREVIWSEYQEFELLQRDTTGKPRNWTMQGGNIKIWPTPDADNLTWFRIHGLKLENDFSNDGATPAIRAHWHNAVVFYAAYLLAGLRGWAERSQHFYRMFMEAIGAALDPTAILLSHQDGRIDIVGDPTGD